MVCFPIKCQRISSRRYGGEDNITVGFIAIANANSIRAFVGFVLVISPEDKFVRLSVGPSNESYDLGAIKIVKAENLGDLDGSLIEKSGVGERNEERLEIGEFIEVYFVAHEVSKEDVKTVLKKLGVECDVVQIEMVVLRKHEFVGHHRAIRVGLSFDATC